ncbi:MAG: hypothetical protein ABIS51_07475, partial [Sphingomonas sp.]
MIGPGPPPTSLVRTVRRLAELAWQRHRRLLLTAVALTVTLAMAELAFLYALMVLLHHMIAVASISAWPALLSIAGLAAALSALRMAALRGQESLGLLVANDIADAIFGAAMQRSLADHRRRRAEEIGVALEEARMIGSTTVVPLLNAGGTLAVIGALAAAIMAIDWRIFAVLGPIMLTAYWAMVARNRQALHRVGAALATARRYRGRIVEEAQADYRHLLLTGAETVARQAYADSARTVAQLLLRHRLLGAMPRAVLEPLLTVAGLATIVLLLRRPGGIDQAIPALAALAAALLRILQATNLLTASLALVQGNIPALARLLRLTT